MFIKRNINFDGMVSDYKFLIHFGKEHINDPPSFTSQLKLLRSLNNANLTNFYNKKELTLLDLKNLDEDDVYDYISEITSDKKENPQFYLTFSIEGDSNYSNDPELARICGTKGKYKGEQIRPVEIKFDSDFFDGVRENIELYDAQYAKFTQNEDLKALLLATNDAKLTHYNKGSPPEVLDDLMIIRDKIRRNDL
jgi:hypothetical protein